MVSNFQDVLNTALSQGVSQSSQDKMKSDSQLKIDSFPPVGINMTDQSVENLTNIATYQNVVNNLSLKFRNEVSNVTSQIIQNKLNLSIRNEAGIYLNNLVVGGNLSISGINISNFSKVVSDVLLDSQIIDQFTNTVQQSFGKYATFDIKKLDTVVAVTEKESAIKTTTEITGFAKALSSITGIPGQIITSLVIGIVFIVGIVGVTLVFLIKYLVSSPELIQGITETVSKAIESQGKGVINDNVLQFNNLLNYENLNLQECSLLI
jgi:hypothetical protein